MTISNLTTRASGTGAGAVLAVAYSFPTTASGDLTVIQRVTATGGETELDETTDYTATYGSSGGTVTTVNSIASTDEIHVIRSTPLTQALDLPQGGAFSSSDIEDALDKLAKVTIELSNDRQRSLRAPNSDAAATDLELPDSVTRASKFLSFDASGNPQASTSVATGSVVYGAFGTLVVATATEAAFKTLANLVIGTDVQAYSAFLAAIVALSKTDGNFIVTNGTTFVAESGATAMTSLGISTFAQTILDDTTALGVRTTIETFEPEDCLFYEGSMLAHDNVALTFDS